MKSRINRHRNRTRARLRHPLLLVVVWERKPGSGSSYPALLPRSALGGARRMIQVPVPAMSVRTSRANVSCSEVMQIVSCTKKERRKTMNEEKDQHAPREISGNPSLPATAVGGAEKKTGIMNFISGITSSLGIGRGKTDDSGASPGDVATTLAHQRTDLAMERNYLAADRTLMAWIRTSLSMISFGFTIGKFGQVMESVEVKGFFHTKMVSVESIAYFLVIIGTVALLMASVQHRVRMRQLYVMGLRRQFSLSFYIALVLIAVGGFALSSLIMAL